MATLDDAKFRLALKKAINLRRKPGWLVVAGSPEPVSQELLALAAGLTSATLAIDAGADTLCQAGIKINALVGDMDSISPQLLGQLRADGTIIQQVSAYKDQTDLELGFEYLHDKGASWVLVLGALGGRLDHQLAVLGSAAIACASMDIILASEDTLVFLLADGESMDLGACFADGQTFSVFALTANACITEQGSEWELMDEQLAVLDSRGVSNLVRNHDTQVTVKGGTAAVIVTR